MSTKHTHTLEKNTTGQEELVVESIATAGRRHGGRRFNGSASRCESSSLSPSLAPFTTRKHNLSFCSAPLGGSGPCSPHFSFPAFSSYLERPDFSDEMTPGNQDRGSFCCCLCGPKPNSHDVFSSAQHKTWQHGGDGDDKGGVEGGLEHRVTLCATFTVASLS